MKVYTVIMYRWGDTERHSYLLGVFDTEEQAVAEGEAECAWRGNKYKPRIAEVQMNAVKKRKPINY